MEMDSAKFLLVLMGCILAGLQIIYRWIDKKNIKDIKDTINAGISSFEPHIERTRRIEGEMKNVSHITEVILSTQQELIKLSETVASTQKIMFRLLEKHGEKINMDMTRVEDKLVSHQESCKDQHQTTREVIRNENRSG